MQFVEKNGDTLVLKGVFNEEHAAQILEQIPGPFSSIAFKDVGIKIMRQVLAYFQEAAIQRVQLEYDWNSIMVTPKLVCYDKNQWKTLQQLNNWNREWNQLFGLSFNLVEVVINISCSWMDEQFAKLLLEGILRLPNVQKVVITLASKNQKVDKLLQAFNSARLFPQFEYRFNKLK